MILESQVLQALFLHLFGFILVHLYQNKGVFAKDTYIEKSTLSFIDIFWNLIEKIPTPSQIIKYSKETVKTCGEPYVLFGMSFGLILAVPLYCWPEQTMADNHTLLFLRFIGVFLCLSLMFYKRYPKFIQRHFHIYWHIVAMYCLPFLSAIVYLSGGQSAFLAVNFAIALIFLAFLTRVLIFCALNAIGILLAGYVHFMMLAKGESIVLESK